MTRAAGKKKVKQPMMLSSRPNPISIASIHATILSIIIAVLSAYAIHIYDVLDQMETRTFQEADKINEVPFLGFYGLSQEATYDPADSKNRQQLAGKAVELIMGVPLSRPDASGAIWLDPATRGEELVRILSSLLGSYPFPSHVIPSKEKVLVSPTAERMHFDNQDALRNWTREVDIIADQIIWAATVHPNKLEEILNAAVQKNLQNSQSLDPVQKQQLSGILTPGALNDLIQSMNSVDAKLMFRLFLQNLQKAKDIAQSVKNSLDQLNAYKERKPSKIQFVIILLFPIAAFTCGVILPMFNPNSSPVPRLWIPTGFYFIAFVYIMFGILRA